jgi:hypothetical protein
LILESDKTEKSTKHQQHQKDAVLGTKTQKSESHETCIVGNLAPRGKINACSAESKIANSSRIQAVLS